MGTSVVRRIGPWLQQTMLRSTQSSLCYSGPLMVRFACSRSFYSPLLLRSAGSTPPVRTYQPGAFLASFPTGNPGKTSTTMMNMQQEQSVRALATKTGRQFYASVGKVADPAPLPVTEEIPIQDRLRQFPTKARREFKSFVNVYRIRRDLGGNSDFSEKTFVDEAAAIYRKFMSALNRLDKGDLRDMLTEDFFARIKKQLPEKGEKKQRKAAGKEQAQPTFVTGDVQFVQARIVTLAVAGDHKFAQVTCDVTLIRPELQRVRLVFERALHAADTGQWRICDLLRLPTPL